MKWMWISSWAMWIGLGVGPASFATAQMINGSDRSTLSIRGDFRFRQEFYGHTDFKSERSASLLRLRPEATWLPSPEFTVVLQPQAAKAFGEAAFVPNSTTTNAATDSSGAQNSDTSPISFHQAYGDYRPINNFTLRIGRQILAYGDELVIGPSDWSNVARTFDAVKLSYGHLLGNSDLFASKLKDTNVTTGGPGDRDLYGFYNALGFGPYLQQLDLYAFEVHDATSTMHPPTTLIAGGVRVKSALGAFDYRVEYTHERGFATPDGEQVNPEVGYTITALSWRPHLSVEYFMATADYNQLYPSPHRWLGYADVLGRRNVEGFGVHASAPVSESVNVRLDYYNFRRHQATQAVFRVDGVTAIGSAAASDSLALGDEIDLSVKYQPSTRVILSAGYMQLYSGSYFNDQFAKKNPNYVFAQFEGNF